MGDGGWMVEVLGSGLKGRHQRYLVAIADRALATAAVIVQFGVDTDIKAVTRVGQAELDVAKVRAGGIVAL
jgi:hypothetical protein